MRRRNFCSGCEPPKRGEPEGAIRGTVPSGPANRSAPLRRRPLRPLLLAAFAVLPALAICPLATRPAGAANEYRLSGESEEIFAEISKIQERKDAAAALPLLQAAVTFTEPHLAVAAGEALRAMGEAELTASLLGTPEFASWWKRALRAKSDTEQIALAHVLGAWRHPSIDEGMAFLASGRRNPDVQAAGLAMAGSLRPDETRRFPLTKIAIGDAIRKGRTEEILCAAASAAGRWRDKAFVEQLVSLVKGHRESYAGLYAVWALKQIGYDGGLGSFIHVASSNPKRPTLQANLKAITELATLKDVEDLLALSRNSKQDLRDAAVLALGRLPWRAQRGRLPGVDAPPVGEITGEAGPAPIIEPLPDPSLDVPNRVIERMIQLVRDDSSWEVRDAARQGLLRFGKRAAPKVLEAMPALVTSNDTDVAYTAIELCGRFGAKAAYAEVLKIALYEQKDRTKRMLAFRALEGIDPAAAVEACKEAVRPRPKPKDSELNAVRCLGYIRTKESFDALTAIVGSTQPFSEGILREAEYALERLTAHRFGRVLQTWQEWHGRSATPFSPRMKSFDRAANRREAMSRGLYGLTQATERAVEGGLRFLARHQHVIGSWDGNERGFGGVVNCEPAYTGLSLLAFLGAGYQGDHGKYCEAIRRASEFLAATQLYDGGFPVTGGGDNSWIYAYLIGMAVWALNESYGLTGDPELAAPAQWGIDYLVRTQTPGAGWRYGPRYVQSDSSCTSWVLMATKMADMIGLDVAQKSWDGVDDWLERCSYDITGEIEKPEDLSNDYDHEVGVRRQYEAFTSYFELAGKDSSGLQKISMTAVGMVCRFFMGWKRSHPFQIGSANFLLKYTPEWMAGMNKDQALAWYHYYWYYGTLAMYQMGGKYWRAWNQKIRKMYPERQRQTDDHLNGSWDPDTTVLNGGRLFSTAMSVLSLESYYRFSPLLGEAGAETMAGEKDAGAPKDGSAR